MDTTKRAAVLYEVRRGVAVVTLRRHQEARNAVDGPTAAALAESFRRFEADPTARAAVLTGEGETFCAGADLKSIGTERQLRLEADGDAPMGLSRMVVSKPVIAAVEGYAVAGGFEYSPCSQKSFFAS